MAQQTIEFNQGDDYLLRLNNFNPEHKYKVYIQFFDEDGAFVGNQLSYDVNYTDSVDVLLPASFTDNLNVPLGEDYQLYYLGGKQAEVVENKVNLYAFDNDDTTLYTHSLEVAVDDVLYDEDNHATEYDVDAINSIVNDSGTFERDSANNFSIRDSELYYTENSIDAKITIKGNTLKLHAGSIICLPYGAYDISEFFHPGDTFLNENFIINHWEFTDGNFFLYLTTNIDLNYNISDVNLSQNTFSIKIQSFEGSIIPKSSLNTGGEVPENYTGYYYKVNGNEGSENYVKAYNNGLVADGNLYSMPIQIIGDALNLYCWSLSGEHIYTLAENPAVGDMTYTYEEELIEGDEITAINSFLVSTDEYIRNDNNDIEIIISTAYTGEKTIISELANKRPVIVYKKRAEGPV